jgi:hypothetical protein
MLGFLGISYLAFITVSSITYISLVQLPITSTKGNMLVVGISKSLLVIRELLGYNMRIYSRIYLGNKEIESIAVDKNFLVSLVKVFTVMEIINLLVL